MGNIRNQIGVMPGEFKIGIPVIRTEGDLTTSDALYIANSGGTITNVQVPNSPLVIGKADVATSGSSTNALDSSRSYIKLTGSTFFTINGIAEGITGQQLTVYNGGTNLALFKHDQDVGDNKIYLQNNSQKVLTPGSLAQFIYDSGWRCISIQNNIYIMDSMSPQDSTDYTELYHIYVYQNASYKIVFDNPSLGYLTPQSIYAIIHLPETMSTGDWIDITLCNDDTIGYERNYIVTCIYEMGSSDHIVVDKEYSHLPYLTPKGSESRIVSIAGMNVRHNIDPSDYITKLYQTLHVGRTLGGVWSRNNYKFQGLY